MGLAGHADLSMERRKAAALEILAARISGCSSGVFFECFRRHGVESMIVKVSNRQSNNQSNIRILKQSMIKNPS